MPFEHEPDTVWKAQELYCVDRLSFVRVAELTGVSATTLKAWAQKYDWAGKREEIARSESDIRINMVRARKTMLEKLLMAEDGKEASQAAFAVSSLEATAIKQQEMIRSGLAPASESLPLPDINNRAELAEALHKATLGKLAQLLTRTDTVSLSAMRDVLACFELVGKVSAEAAGESGAASSGPAALSAQNMQAIRELLGV